MKKKILGGLLTLLLCLGGSAACNFNFEWNIGGQSSVSQSEESSSDDLSSEEISSSASNEESSWLHSSDEVNESSSEGVSSSEEGSSSEESSSSEEGSSSEENSSEEDSSGNETDEDSSSVSDGESSSESSDSGEGDSSSENPDEGDDENDSSSENPDGGDGDIVTEDMSIHFLYLGNATPGDCTLIKVGDTEVLIDAGSTTGSVATIVPYIREYCTDGVLEYVVVTHADSDHISGFVGGSRGKGVFDSFVCETIIEYARTNKNTDIRKEYEALRDKEVAEGATHYTALECWNETDGAKRSYTLGEGITMQILYQKYYEQKTSDENDYSVCLLVSQNDTHYLFTGDLEENGEKSLVASNTLPKCKLFKGGHHGSATSNTPLLLSVIQPEIVCVCTCCGETNYKKFPTQEFINHVAPYTDKVYMTTVRNSKGEGVPLNGNIVVSCLGSGEVSVNCSNNNLLFKETAWFKENRVCPDEWQ